MGDEKVQEEEFTETSEAGKKVQKKKKKIRKSKKYGITVKAKKKQAVARATIKTGSGRIRVNGRRLEAITPRYVNELIMEPLRLAGGLTSEVDISVSTKGGGFMGQAVSARAAIAKALVEYSSDKKLRQAFTDYDRMLLVDDSRRTEPKKPLGPKARRKKQKSKR